MTEPTLLERILAPHALAAWAQPIVDVSGEPRVVGAELLIRGPAGTNAATPDVLFEYARRKHKEAAVDLACIGTLLAAARFVPPELALHLNVHASTLTTDATFLSFLLASLAREGVDPRRTTLEIVEHGPPTDVPRFQRVISEIREAGILVALDDVGLGHSNFRMIVECSPDCFKVDRYFVAGAANDRRKRAVLSCIASLAEKFGAAVVAEGVETPSCLQVVRAAGIRLAQGWLFARPFPVEEWSTRLAAPLVYQSNTENGDRR